MKKILVIASTFPRWKNDVTPAFVYELSNRLAKKDRKIIVLAPHAPNASKNEKFGNLEVHRFQYFIPSKMQKIAYGAGVIPNIRGSFLAKLQLPFFLLSECISAARLIKKYKPDILHAHWLIPQGVLAAILKRTHKLPFIVTAHGSDLFPLKSRVFKYFQRIVLNACYACTVNSIATKNEIAIRFPEFSSKLKVIPMGVDTRFFVPKNIKSKYKQYSNKKIILFVGRLNEQKGIQYLIKSIPIVKKEFSNAQLLIIGEGDYKAEMKKLAISLGISNSVEFLGGMHHSRIVDYYNLADVLVLPSITSKIGVEGQGLVLLEAMACGTCVIGTPTGGIKSIIKNNENGLLVREKDESNLARNIIKVLFDDKLKQKLSKNGIKFVREKYSWYMVTKKFNELYNHPK